MLLGEVCSLNDSGHHASLPGILAAFAYHASLVNPGPMPVAHSAVITCDDDGDDGINGDDGNGEGKVVELMKQNDSEAVVKIEWKQSCLEPRDSAEKIQVESSCKRHVEGYGASLGGSQCNTSKT